MRFTQEPQLERDDGDNEGLGWQIDSAGRYWHNGGTGGFRAFVGFDPKTRRGVVVLASTVDLARRSPRRRSLQGSRRASRSKPPMSPTADQLAPFAGTYELGDFKLGSRSRASASTSAAQGEPPLRLIPISDHEFWIESLQSVAWCSRRTATRSRARCS